MSVGGGRAGHGKPHLRPRRPPLRAGQAAEQTDSRIAAFSHVRGGHRSEEEPCQIRSDSAASTGERPPGHGSQPVPATRSSAGSGRPRRRRPRKQGPPRCAGPATASSHTCQCLPSSVRRSWPAGSEAGPRGGVWEELGVHLPRGHSRTWARGHVEQWAGCARVPVGS